MKLIYPFLGLPTKSDTFSFKNGSKSRKNGGHPFSFFVKLYLGHYFWYFWYLNWDSEWPESLSFRPFSIFFYLCFLILAGFLTDSCRIYVRFLKDFGRILEKIFSSCLLSLIVSVNACDYVDFCIFKVFFFTSLFLFHEPLSDASFSSDRQRWRGR